MSRRAKGPDRIDDDSSATKTATPQPATTGGVTFPPLRATAAAVPPSAKHDKVKNAAAKRISIPASQSWRDTNGEDRVTLDRVYYEAGMSSLFVRRTLQI